MSNRRALLNDKGELIGAESMGELRENDIDAGDLPADGTYVWNGERFIPKGYEKGKPTPPQVDRDEAFYLLAKAMINETSIPQEVTEYLTWYETNIRRV